MNKVKQSQPRKSLDEEASLNESWPVSAQRAGSISIE